MQISNKSSTVFGFIYVSFPSPQRIFPETYDLPKDVTIGISLNTKEYRMCGPQ